MDTVAWPPMVPWRDLWATATNGARGDRRLPSIERTLGSGGVREATQENGWLEWRAAAWSGADRR